VIDWGGIFNAAYDAASETAKQAADLMMSSASAASKAVARAAAATADRIVETGAAIGRGTVAVGKGTTNVAGFGARAVVEAGAAMGRASVAIADATLTGSPVGAPYLAAKKLLAPRQTPRQAFVEPCPTTVEGKRKRLEERQQLITIGRRPGASAESRAAADRLESNNLAVELARLSDDTYAQYANPPVNQPPPGWMRLTDQELAAQDINTDLLKTSKAVIYQTPADWPGGQKTVLAFRGTKDKEDWVTNYKQAMAMPTAEYRDAARLGSSVSKAFGDGVLVTGHSLGAGKGAAAGTFGGLRGMMFNGAGLHPATLKGMMPASDQFIQYRTLHDPLTGLQNSALAQTAAAAAAGVIATPMGLGMKLGGAAGSAVGLPELSTEMADYVDKATQLLPRALRNLWAYGNMAPPAIGRIEEVPALDKNGEAVSAVDPLGQHEITHLVNGIEQQKVEDVATLRAT
jgi:hypothetical protein